MPAPTWDPEDKKPENAATLERAMRETAPAAEIKLTLVEGEWLVRALLPAAMCARGSGFADRDVSLRVAERLSDEGLPASIFSRAPRAY